MISPTASRPSPPARAARRTARAGRAQDPAAPTPAGETSAALVSLRVRRLEPLLGWTLAGYTLWLAILVLPGSVSVWAGALFAACVGGWARAFPARRQVRMFGRGALLVLGALVMHSASDAGGPTGVLFFWTVAVSCTYALLLRPRWALLLAALCMAEFILAVRLHPTGASWQWLAAQAASLLAFPLLAWSVGRELRTADAQLEAALLDRHTHLYNEAGLRQHGQPMLERCRARGVPLTMVMFGAADLNGVQDLLGRAVADRMLRRAVRGMMAALPPDGIGARLSANTLVLLLPDMDEPRATALVHAQLGDPPAITLQHDKRHLRIVLDMIVMRSLPDMPDLDAFTERLSDRLARLRQSAQVSVPESATRPPLDMDSFLPDLEREISKTVPMKL